MLGNVVETGIRRGTGGQGVWYIGANTPVSSRVAMFVQVRQIARFLCNHPLTRDHRAAGFVRLFKWQIESRLRREVIVPWIGGGRLAPRSGMTGATGNIYAGLHEFADMAFSLHFLRPDDLFMGVGANI